MYQDRANVVHAVGPDLNQPKYTCEGKTPQANDGIFKGLRVRQDMTEVLKHTIEQMCTPKVKVMRLLPIGGRAFAWEGCSP